MEDWLLSVELFELASGNNDVKFAQEIKDHLEIVKQQRPEVGHLIDDGIAVVEKKGILN
jgi:phenylalanine-4-hydroxylase